MTQPLVDLALPRFTREHYIIGNAAINFPYPDVLAFLVVLES
jgi:hypothetical protein